MSTALIVAGRIRTAAGVPGDAILVRDGRVAAVGHAGDLRSPGLAETHYPGAVVVPGLRDAHFHPLPYVAALTRLTLKDAVDFSDLADRIREAAATLPPGSPLVGTRLDDETLAERRLPHRSDLDRALPDRPVLLYRYCGHVAVVNSAALRMSGITELTPDPPAGSIDRNVDGVPNGILRETAIELVARRMGGRSAGLEPAAVLAALRSLPAAGLTALGAILATGTGPWGDTGNELATILEVADELPLKLSVLVIADTEARLEHAAASVAAAGSRLRFLGVKEFADGSLGGHTAAMRAPFHDRPNERGTLRLDPVVVGRRARMALGLGGKVAVHAIGDLANARVLDLFDGLLREGASPVDLRVEHASILGDDEVARFAATGVIASVQPAFLLSEAAWLEKRLGPQRLQQAYPLATLAGAGVALAGGSDCPVEPPDPLLGMAAARHRAGIVPSEALTGEQALALFTDGAAQAIGEDRPLAVGSPADLAVLDGDPVEADAIRLPGTKVLATWIDGAPVEFPSEEIPWPG